jgi:hypothetical protein
MSYSACQIRPSVVYWFQWCLSPLYWFQWCSVQQVCRVFGQGGLKQRLNTMQSQDGKHCWALMQQAAHCLLAVVGPSDAMPELAAGAPFHDDVYVLLILKGASELCDIQAAFQALQDLEAGREAVQRTQRMHRRMHTRFPTERASRPTSAETSKRRACIPTEQASRPTSAENSKRRACVPTERASRPKSAENSKRRACIPTERASRPSAAPPVQWWQQNSIKDNVKGLSAVLLELKLRSSGIFKHRGRPRCRHLNLPLDVVQMLRLLGRGQVGDVEAFAYGLAGILGAGRPFLHHPHQAKATFSQHLQSTKSKCW